jgi:NAD(P)-dependent dehydrogenase (short-subunit alcohol dehydrogenase family)
MGKTIVVVGYGPGISSGVAEKFGASGFSVALVARIYVGEVMVAGTVKGTAGDSGQASTDPAAVANKFWELYRARGESRARVA